MHTFVASRRLNMKISSLLEVKNISVIWHTFCLKRTPEDTKPNSFKFLQRTPAVTKHYFQIWLTKVTVRNGFPIWSLVAVALQQKKKKKDQLKDDTAVGDCISMFQRGAHAGWQLTHGKILQKETQIELDALMT
ncbi:hypothetical protein ACJX0J_041305, partial [Zea mays]